eukprot:gene8443-9309_t
MLQVLDKKTVHRLGTTLNHGAASKPSDYAMKLMNKMGWKEGQGLGRNSDGISSHVKIDKREDNLGLGLGKESKDAPSASALSENWWHTDFSSKLKKFSSAIKVDKDKKKSKKRDRDSRQEEEEEGSDSERRAKKKKSKKEKKAKREKEAKEVEEESPEEAALDYQELFKATGGARLGMRARRDQKGKISRTEGLQAIQ